MARKKRSSIVKEPTPKSQEELDKELIARSATRAVRLDSVEKAIKAMRK